MWMRILKNKTLNVSRGLVDKENMKNKGSGNEALNDITVCK